MMAENDASLTSLVVEKEVDQKNVSKNHQLKRSLGKIAENHASWY